MWKGRQHLVPQADDNVQIDWNMSLRTMSRGDMIVLAETAAVFLLNLFEFPIVSHSYISSFCHLLLFFISAHLSVKDMATARLNGS